MNDKYEKKKNVNKEGQMLKFHNVEQQSKQNINHSQSNSKRKKVCFPKAV